MKKNIVYFLFAVKTGRSARFTEFVDNLTRAVAEVVRDINMESYLCYKGSCLAHFLQLSCPLTSLKRKKETGNKSGSLYKRVKKSLLNTILANLYSLL